MRKDAASVMPVDSVSVEKNLGSQVAAGRTAEIFAWGNENILKLTRPGFPSQLADQEWRNAEIVCESSGLFVL